MGKPKITLYVDVVSPFAYLGYWVTRNSPAFKNVEITYVPILLGGLMRDCKNTPPLNIINKDKWINVERQRWASLFNIPMADKTPDPFPQSTVNTMRALTYILLNEGQEAFAKALDKVYHAFWAEGKTPIADIEILKGILGDGKWVEGIKSDQVKKALTDNTKKSFADGAFGLPWFVAENSKGQKEGFWGVDHMKQLLDFLEVDVPGKEGYRAML